MEDVREQFLTSIANRRSKNTLRAYRIGLDRFTKWYNKNLGEILEERRQDLASQDPMRMRHFNDVLEKYAKAMTEDMKLGINTARTNTLGVIQFFSFFCVPVRVSFKTVITKKTHVPEISEFRRMYQVADLKGKVVISLAMDLAWRVGDFLELKKSDIPDLNAGCPIPIEKLTAKEKELSSTFISCETVALLKEYMPSLPRENEYLFPNRNTIEDVKGSKDTDRVKTFTHVEDSKINELLHDLANKIHMKIPSGKHFSFHSFRKRFLSTATNLGIDTEVKDLLVGKAIDSSHMTYYGDLQLKNAFVEIRVKALSLSETPQTQENHVVISELQQQITKLQETVKDRDSIIAMMLKQMQNSKGIGVEYTKDRKDIADALKKLES